MFQIGNIVTVTNDSISYRLNDPKLSAYFAGYAYSSEKKLTGRRCKVINTFDEEITKDGTTEVTHYVVIQNLDSKYNEVYIVDESIVEEIETEMTVAEIEELLGERCLVVDELDGEDTLLYPNIDSFKGNLVKMANGSIYYAGEHAFVSKNGSERKYEDYNEFLQSNINPSFDVVSAYSIRDTKQIYSLEIYEEDITWSRPNVITVYEASRRIGYKIRLKAK